ncbi:MAG: argininosuccinate lyase [Clostridia bacterium]|nr:argininosuccinate lyase [Clostridia bacterium]
MEKMWAGRTDGNTSKIADDFNSSIKFDKRLFEEDIKGSMAHAMMLSVKNIISKEEEEKLLSGLESILNDIKSGELIIDENAEDIHMFVEKVLTERIGETGKKLHTARSRNDQVALDLKMYTRSEIETIISKLKDFVTVISSKADQYKKSIMPGYTHLQRAQPVTFGHHLMTYAMMFLRDISRLNDCRNRLNVSPIGSCALAGTTYDTDRYFEAEKLGFDSVTLNSIDGVSDRDYCVELLADLSLLMVHLSRLSEEIILWSSWEFKFVELSDAFTTGSSIMPQKKNSDMAELVRGKSGRVIGDLVGTLTMLKGLPLAYNKDMQEDKESLFDALDTVKMSLDVYIPMLNSMIALEDNMINAAKGGFINATDLADYLVKKGMPFRTAYKVSGSIVSYCIKNGKTLDTLSLDEYKQFDELFENDLYDAISLETCVSKRISVGGTSAASFDKQLEFVKTELMKF